MLRSCVALVLTASLVVACTGDDDGQRSEIRGELIDWLIDVGLNTRSEAECNADYMLDKGLTDDEVREFTRIPAGTTPEEYVAQEPSRNEVLTAASLVCNYDENGNAIERRAQLPAPN